MKNFLQLIIIGCFVFTFQVDAKSENRNQTINLKSKICNVGKSDFNLGNKDFEVSTPLVQSKLLSIDCNNPTVLVDGSPEPGATTNAGVYAPVFYTITVPAGSHLSPPTISGGVDHIAQVITGACPGTPTGSFCAPATYRIRVSSPSSNQGTFNITASIYTNVVDIAIAETSGVVPNDATVCRSDAATLTASISSGGTASTYAWNTGGSGPSIVVNPLTTTLFTVTITDTNGCTDTRNTTVNVNPLTSPTITFTETSGLTNNDGTICTGAMVTLTSSSTPTANTYVWNTGDVTNAITQSPTTNTTYTVTITDINGCTGSTLRTVVVNILPTPIIVTTEAHGTLPNDGIICLGNNVMLTASGGNSYSWSNGQMIATINPIPPLGMTIYTVTVTSALGCTATAQVEVTANALPTASNTTLRECADPLGSTTATFTFTDAAEIPGWVGGNSNALNEIDNGITGLTVTYHNTLAGAQANNNLATNTLRTNGALIYGRVFNPTTGCFNVSTITLTVDPTPVFSNTTLRACEDPNAPGTAEFDLTDATLVPGWPAGNSNNGVDIDNGVGGVTASFHATLLDAQTNTNSTIADQGSYSASIVFARIENNVTECFAVAQVTLQIDPLPAAFDTELRECEDPVGSNSAMFMLDDANMTPGFNSVPKTNSNVIADVDGGIANLTVTYHLSEVDAENETGIAGNGSYSNGTILWARVENNVTLCARVSMVTLTVTPAPDGVGIQNTDNGNSPNNFEICAGDDINLLVDVPTGLPPYTYSWTLPSGTATGSPLAISPAVVATHNGTWVVTVTDVNGCTATDNIVITVIPNPATDQCANASNGGTGTAPISVPGNNICATQDETAGCGDADEASVWITYTVPPEGLKSLQLTLAGLTGGVVRAYDGCGGSLAGDSGCGSAVQIDCPPPGTVYRILVSSSRANQGNFTLNIRPEVNLLNIIGRVYVDVNGDGMPQPTENGYIDITLELVAGCPASGPVVGTTMTAGDGTYSFMNIPPGSYTVRITTPPANNPSGPRDCCLTVPPCLEPILECNLGFALENCDQNSQAGTECITAPLLCNVKQIEEFCSGLPIEEGSLSGTVLCQDGGGGVFNNTSWFQFVAGYGDYTFSINPFDCVPGGGGALGVQAGIFRECDDLSDPVICIASCSTNPVSVPTSELIPGNIYYFFLDGCAGSICSYTVQITGNYVAFRLPTIDSLSLQSPCSPLCALSNIYTFKAFGTEPVTGTTFDDLTSLTYFWTLTDPMGGVSMSITETNEIEIFPVFGGRYTLCLDKATNVCSEVGPFCRTFDVLERLPDDYLGEFVICTGNFPWDGLTPDARGNTPIDKLLNPWLGPEIQLADIQAGQFDFSFENTTNCGCRYTQAMRVRSASSSTGNTDIAICQSELPFTFDTLEITTSLDSFLYKFKSLKSINGCDSLVKINARILNLRGNIRRGTCTPAGISMFFEIAPLFLGADRDSIKYVWKNPAGAIIADNDSDPSTILVPVDGRYSVEVTVFKYGKGCTFPFFFNLNTSDLQPLNPIPDAWPLKICENDPEATYMVSSPEPNTRYIWTIPSTATVVQNDSSSVLIVRWNAAPGGNICVRAQNQCGSTPDVCLPVIFVDQTDPVFTLASEICKDDFTTITTTTTHISGTVYNWTFDGGTTVGNGTGPGPHEISWNIEGTKTITLSVNENGCISQIYSATIDVVLPLPVPQFDCTSSISGVDFTWPDVPEATGYSVTVITGQPGVQGTNIYNVTGLAIGESVSAQLTVSTNHPCGDIVSAISECITQDCPQVNVAITAVPPICLTATTPTITLVATTTPNTPGTFTFGGPGVTGNVFDPKLANIGNNVITCVFRSDVGNCVYNAIPRTIVVNPTPLSTFTLNRPTACVRDSVVVTYTGGTVGGVYTWNFGTDVIGTYNGPGPHNVKWSTPGPKTITLTVVKDGCTSTVSTQAVTLVPLLTRPVPTCVPQSTVDAVEFSWGAVANASGYEVFINGVRIGIQNTLTYRITGLAQGTRVTIRVVAISNNGCPSTDASITCIASNCPPNTRLAFPQALVTLCLEPNSPKIPLTYTVTGTSGIGVPTATWSGPGVDNTARTFDPVVAGIGNHFVKLLFIENTCETLDSFLVTIKAKPIASFTSLDTICVDNRLTLTYTGTRDATLKYLWDATGATITPLTNNRFDFKWATPGTYTIKLKVDVRDCESIEVSKTIIVEGVPTPPIIRCVQALDNVRFTWTAIPCATQYRVFINNVLIGTQTTLTYAATGLLEGEKVEIRVEPISRCKCPILPISLTCEAKACPPVVITLRPDRNQICFNGASTPKIPINLTVTGNTPDGRGTWTGVGLTNTVFDPVVSGIGTFTLVYRYTDSGCDYADSTTIKVDPNPAIIWEIQNPACFNQTTGSFNYELKDGTAPYTTTLDGRAVSNLKIDDIATGAHKFIAVDANGCRAEVDFTISSVSQTSFQISGPTIVSLGRESTHTINQADFAGLKIDSIVWKHNGLRVCTGVQNCFEYKTTANKGENNLEVTVYFNSECQVRATYKFVVTDQFITEFPNIINPNSTSGNDKFSIFTTDESLFVKTMRVYDRWGNKVFEALDFSAFTNPVGWDGTFGGRELVPGVFTYIFEMENAKKKNIIEKGDVTVLR